MKTNKIKWDTIDKIKKEVDKKFTDQYWFATQGHNDLRNSAVLSFIEKVYTQERKEGYKEGYWERDEDDKVAEEMEKSDAAHRTAEGYCCACGYDMAVMEGKIKEAREKGKKEGYQKGLDDAVSEIVGEPVGKGKK